MRVSTKGYTGKFNVLHCKFIWRLPSLLSMQHLYFKIKIILTKILTSCGQRSARYKMGIYIQINTTCNRISAIPLKGVIVIIIMKYFCYRINPEIAKNKTAVQYILSSNTHRNVWGSRFYFSRFQC